MSTVAAFADWAATNMLTSSVAAAVRTAKGLILISCSDSIRALSLCRPQGAGRSGCLSVSGVRSVP
ncbi:hypothetical protein GCM10010466_07720 [Planomonospora alba]|uniref:Uncharacterized protein n=1 Tax=Planomonospora alba TaxID=161354 RepID=A0ABP6MQR5_9ACTN